jgi:hypothetical protein
LRMQVEERFDPRKMNMNEGIQQCDATALAVSEGNGGTAPRRGRHIRVVGGIGVSDYTTIGRREANAAFEYCFGKTTVLRLFNLLESNHKRYSLFQPFTVQWSLYVLPV